MPEDTSPSPDKEAPADAATDQGRAERVLRCIVPDGHHPAVRVGDSLAALILAFPGEVADIERDRRPARDLDL